MWEYLKLDFLLLAMLVLKDTQSHHETPLWTFQGSSYGNKNELIIYTCLAGDHNQLLTK